MSELLPCPFCGGKARHYAPGPIDHHIECVECYADIHRDTEAEAIAAWNSRAELGSKPPYDELLRCLENDWNIRASWDGLRKFWSIELTEEGVRLRDAELNSRAERTCEFAPDGMMDDRLWYSCSNCGGYITTDYGMPSYCPHCGAEVRNK